jgi:DNA-directed RNA polymerase subunit beta'
VPHVIEDLKLIKGQKNDEFWRRLRLGQTPVMPNTPLVYEKFRDLVKGAGVSFNETPTGDSIFGMTNKQCEDLTGNNRLESGKTYDTKMRPIEGGLFSPAMTDSLGEGNRWSYLQLPEPMINPVMEQPIRVLLGMTGKELNAMIDQGGAPAVTSALKRLDLQAVAQRAQEEIKTGAPSRRDAAIKRYGYAQAMIKNGVRPEDFIMTRVPVIPPRYRPIMVQNGLTVVTDMNRIYKAMTEATDDYNDVKEHAPDLMPQARAGLWNAYKAVVGTADPAQPKLQQAQVGGILQSLFGKGSPKFSFVMRRVIGSDADVGGLGVAIPDPHLKMNEVGLPENKAWELYEPFVIRQLVRSGMPATAAAVAVQNRTPAARKALVDTAEQRPVLINRAPTLHKYNIMAFKAKLVPGEAVRMNPLTTKPYNLDFDGDKLSYSVPITQAAVQEAWQKMTPEHNLLSARNDKPLFQPRQEFAQGLFFATQPPKASKAQRFATDADAVLAFRKGQLRVDDPVVIGS